MICKTLSFNGKLIGAEATDGLVGNDNWNSLADEAKEALRKRLHLSAGDYLWLVFGEREIAVRTEYTKKLATERTPPRNQRAAWHNSMRVCGRQSGRTHLFKDERNARALDLFLGIESS